MKSPMHQFYDTLPASRPYTPTGPIQNARAAFGMFVDENMSISRWKNEGPLRDSKNTLFNFRGTGELVDREFDMFANDGPNGVDIRWDELINYTNKKLGKNLKTHTQLEQEMREDLKLRRTERQDIMSKASGFGISGQFVGTFAAAIVDPIAIPSYFIGYGIAAKSASLLARLGKGALVAGAVEGVTEAAIQPFVRSWKSDIGVDYSTGESVRAIMFATGAGATMGAFGVGVSAFIKRSRSIINSNPYAKAAAEELERMQQLGHGADPKADAVEYYQAIAQKIQNMETTMSKKIDIVKLTQEEIDFVSDELIGSLQLDELGMPKLDNNRMQVMSEAKTVKEVIEVSKKRTNILEDLRNCVAV